jgi:hypothetical protein
MVTSPLFLEVENLRRRWGWLMTLGILMLILETIALITMPALCLQQL